MIRTVLVPLSGTDCDDAALTTATRVFSGGRGHIECLRLNPDPAQIIAECAQVDMGGWMIASDTVAAIEKEAQERTRTAQAALAAFRKREDIPMADDPPGPEGISVSYREDTGDEFDRITAFARYHDVVILGGGRDRPGRLSLEALGGIIIDGGRPVMLAPEVAKPGPINRIAIAWKDSPEAARAVAAAMPLLERAQHVDVYSANESDREANECAECYGRIVRYLRWHGVNAIGHFVVPAGRTPAEVVLEEAAAADADLLVMGAYGHSRVREFVFGGFTERVLKGAALPILLCH